LLRIKVEYKEEDRKERRGLADDLREKFEEFLNSISEKVDEVRKMLLTF